MAGAQKKRLARERKNKKPAGADDHSDDEKSQSTPQEQSPAGNISPPSRLDGNRDPSDARPRSGSNASQRSQGGNQGQVSATGASPHGQGPSSATGAASANQGQAVMTGGAATKHKNLDLGAFAALTEAGYKPEGLLPSRPKDRNKTGREVKIKLNHFPVQTFPTQRVYQYDVMISSGNAKPGLIRAVWESPTLQKALTSTGGTWIFDGSRLAWSTVDMTARYSEQINLDKEYNRTPKKKDGQEVPDKHNVMIARTKEIRFDALRGYLEGSTAWGTEILDSINFMDHMLREGPSKRYIPIKRMFFDKGKLRSPLGGGIEAFRGVYASIRPVRMPDQPKGQLSVNVDVANTCFWSIAPVHVTAKDLCGYNNPLKLETFFREKREINTIFHKLRRLEKVKVYFKHTEEGEEESKKHPLTIKRIIPVDSKTEKFLPEGYTSPITVEEFFKKKYNKKLEFPFLPLVQMTKEKIKVPMEMCWIVPNQRYNYKLDERQTSEMIKFAVTVPSVRWGHIEDGLKMLNWPEDHTLAKYGTKITQQATRVTARVLPNPKVMFAQNSQQNPVDPKTYGRWDLRGKVFIEPHATPLSVWGVCILTGNSMRPGATVDQVRAFLQTFISTFKGHGGKITQTAPTIMECPAGICGDDAGEAVKKIWDKVVAQGHGDPQFLMFIVPDRDARTYLRIKKSCDCRYGIVSQVIQSAHAQKNQAQYCSNVSMKVNAKLGGATAKAIGIKGPNGWFSRPTMIISADVTHAPPDTEIPSIAAITMSWDRSAMRYIAGVQSNGYRTEMVTSENIESIMTPMAKNWTKVVGGGNSPQHVIYVRDGVSEGQYSQVLHQEVPDMRKVIQKCDPKANPQFTVVVATKRHHIRFFPEPQGSGDKNGNPLPGTLVDTGATCPFEYDFYLCAHSAIKGTARPVHYQVLLDEAKMGVEQLQNWIYEASYQFVRSTTPVSMFPGAYYADLAAGRALAHISGYPRKTTEQTPPHTKASAVESVEVKKLIPWEVKYAIPARMWYV